MKRPALPGSREALEDLQVAKFNLQITCRVMKQLIRNAEHLVRQSERYGSSSNFSRIIEDTAVKLSMTVQDATRAGNSARRALRRFADSNVKNKERGNNDGL